MTKAGIVAELPHLTAAELAEVQAKLDELAGSTWLDDRELSAADVVALEAGLRDYQQNPHAGSSWDQVKRRIQSKLGRRAMG